MSDYNLSGDIVASVRQHCGISNMPSEALEIVWPEAEKAAKDRGVSIEFIAADLVRALWAKANMEHRQAGKAGQPLDFQAYCREKLSKKDGLFKRLLSRKQSAAQQQAEVEAYEQEIESARRSLAASSQKVVELKNDISSTESELSNHTDYAVEESIQEAAKLWSQSRSRSRDCKSDLECAADSVARRVEQARAVSRELQS
jgi:chromosome segregation ATPase